MASVLETFMMVFESDASNVKDGAKEADDALDKVENKAKKTNQATEKLGAGFKTMLVGAAAALTAVMSVGALSARFGEAVDYADKLGETAGLLGLATEQLGAWGQAAKLAGGSSEAFIGSIKNLSTAMTQLDVVGTSRVKPFFDELGISLTDTNGKVRDVMEVLPDLADKFEDMSRQQSASFGRKLGLDEGTIMLLQRGRREVEALVARQKEYGSITKENAEISSDYNDALDNSAYSFKIMASEIASVFLPVLTKVINGMARLFSWMSDNKTFVIAFFATATAALIPFAAAALSASLPFLAITAAITLAIAAYAALWEDLYNFSSGADSVTGRILTAFAKIPVFLKKMAAEIGSVLKGIFSQIVDDIVQLVSGLIVKVADAFAQLFRAFGIDEAFGKMETLKAIRDGKQTITQASSSTLNSQTSSSIANSSRAFSRNTNVSIDSVTVQTQATDADGIAASFDNSLQKQIGQATNNFDDGWAY